MSTIIKFDIKELKKLANDKNSCIVEKKVTQNLALQPWCLGNLTESIKNLLDYKIGKFDKEFNGILLSYKNSKILGNVGAIRNDNADVHFQVQAEYYIFQPYVGATLTGIVNIKSNTYLGILVHRVFNVVIPRPTEQPGGMWIGSNIQLGQEVTFRIVVLDLFGALPYIRGELDESCIKVDPEADEDDEIDEETKSIQAFDVSYVDFDKTKPINQKHSGDDVLSHSKLKSNSKTNNIQISENKESNISNGKSVKVKKANSEIDVGEGSNSKKRHSRAHVSDQKPYDDSVKPSKQHKREA